MQHCTKNSVKHICTKIDDWSLQFFYEASESRRNVNEKYFHDSRSHIAPAQSSLAMMIHFIFYRFAINPMPYCLNQFHFCSTYAWVSYFLNMIRVVKKTGKAEKTWLSDYAISASNFDLAPKSFISQFFFRSVLEIFICFLGMWVEWEKKYDSIDLWLSVEGTESAKNRQTEQRKLRDEFFWCYLKISTLTLWASVSEADGEMKEKFFTTPIDYKCFFRWKG